ncbi:twin transmembrane helix small protein [Pseudooceanicola sp. CBS1P-1]|uniref:Twin transmembrane helix small protein n=1 Tax=Pseudooceanicola albus TaxID=2692189 RepID=A0A6L7G9Q1_9RHOB|nr:MULTISPECIES: twin transmembrane helix small protein [Pseudooceanicola]MBT9382818.1 twin transmembrane helix small protein [Pseudooceanicola endophyticus]MXN20258.1 twin transmembrane helix small protein [Pseudooceanicola albus]
MAGNPMFFIATVAVLIVAVILVKGIANFARAGDARKSNKLMQWRIMAQLVAVLLIALAAMITRGH